MAAISLKPRASALWPTVAGACVARSKCTPSIRRSVVTRKSSFSPRGRKMAQSSPMPKMTPEPRGIAIRPRSPSRMLSSVNSQKLGYAQIALQRRQIPPKTRRSGLTPIGPSETIQVHFQMVVRIGNSGNLRLRRFCVVAFFVIGLLFSRRTMFRRVCSERKRRSEVV